MIKKYTKLTDQHTTYTAIEPDYQEGDPRITELCTLDGETYLHIPDDVILPTQPDQITLVDVTLDGDLLAIIKKASPHVRLINERVVAKIREKYTANDELKMHREYVQDGSTPGTQAYIAYVAECRAWGATQKALIGLG